RTTATSLQAFAASARSRHAVASAYATRPRDTYAMCTTKTQPSRCRRTPTATRPRQVRIPAKDRRTHGRRTRPRAWLGFRRNVRDHGTRYTPAKSAALEARSVAAPAAKARSQPDQP